MLDGIGEGQILLADRAYDSDALRNSLSRRGAWANVKPMPNRVNIPAFSAFLYRQRNAVETLLQQDQALPSHRHTLRQARRQLPRPRQTRQR